MTSTPTTELETTQQRARHRFIGACVMALAAAVLLPLLFEKDPPPLPNDVDVRIPPIERLDGKDGKKFDPKNMKSARVVDAPMAPLATPVAPAAESQTSPAQTTQVTSPTPAAPTSSPTSTPATSLDLAAAPQSSTAAVAGKKNAEINTDLNSTPKGLVSGAFIVQVAALKTEASANEILLKLRAQGFGNAYREIIDVSGGKVTRIRLGPFKNKAEAELSRKKIIGFADLQPDVRELK